MIADARQIQRASRSRDVVEAVVWIGALVVLLILVGRCASSGDPIDESPYQAEVDLLIADANARNSASVARFNVAVQSAWTTADTEFPAAATQAARHVRGYYELAVLVVLAARDGVAGSETANHYLTEEIASITDPTWSRYALAVNHAAAALDSELRASSVQLAKQLAAVGPTDADLPTRIELEPRITREFDALLTQLGVITAVSGAFLPMDAHVIQGLGGRLARTAARLFSKPIARASAIPVIAALDGPFPFGDAVSAVLTGWTLWDMHQLADEFEREVHGESLRVLLAARGEMARAATNRATKLAARTAALNQRIARDALQELSK
jgi:hypothetical protein